MHQGNANASLYSVTEETRNRKNACRLLLDNSRFYCIIPHLPANKGASRNLFGRASTDSIYPLSLLSCLSSAVFEVAFNSDKLFHGLVGSPDQDSYLIVTRNHRQLLSRVATYTCNYGTIQKSKSYNILLHRRNFCSMQQENIYDPCP